VPTSSHRELLCGGLDTRDYVGVAFRGPPVPAATDRLVSSTAGSQRDPLFRAFQRRDHPYLLARGLVKRHPNRLETSPQVFGFARYFGGSLRNFPEQSGQQK
jgi:hypothetical protein